MGEGAQIHKLKAWRAVRSLTLEDAAAMVVVDGEPCTKSTWFGWENGKVPKPAWMIALCDLTGLEPNDFYVRPDGGGFKRRGSGGDGGGGAKAPAAKSGKEPPQMAFAI